MSAHVSVLAGICTIRLQGTVIFVLLIVTLPPQYFLSATSGQALLSALTVASWMKPVSSKPWMSAGATENTGSGSVGTGFGATTPLVGGFAVPPLAYATTAPAAKTRRLRTPIIAMRRRRVVRSVWMLTCMPPCCFVQRVRGWGTSWFVRAPRGRHKVRTPLALDRVRARACGLSDDGRRRPRTPFGAAPRPSGGLCPPAGGQRGARRRATAS